MKYPLHFAHANGLPSAAYGLLMDKLSAWYQVSNIPVLGHDPEYPVTNNWPHLKRQLINSIEQTYQTPVIGVGHSLGGALTLMASLDRPDLFRGVVILDVPTFSRLESWVVYAAKKTGWIDHITPAHKSRYRRTNWPSRDAALAYFRERRLFSRFHEQCLNDYVSSVLVPNSQGSFDLGYRLDVELAVFRTVPHAMVLDQKQLKVPMGMLVGQQTDTVRKAQYRRMKHKLGFAGKRVPGSHMFPLEYPLETARDIHSLIHRMGIH